MIKAQDITMDDQSEICIPLALAYMALRVSQSGGFPVFKELEAAIYQSDCNSTGAKLKELALSGMPDAILPFRRHSLDIAYASAVSSMGSHFRFTGLGHCVKAGFFEYGKEYVKYYDEASTHMMYREEILPWQATQDLISTLQGCSSSSVYCIVEDPCDRGYLSISGGWVAEILRMNNDPSRRTPPKEHLTLQARLLTQDTTQTQPYKSVGLGTFDFSYGSNDLVLKSVRPEQLMELQAAWINAQDKPWCLWLSLENDAVRLLFPLSDITEPGTKRACWLSPLGHLQTVLGGGRLVSAYLSRDEASALMKSFHWMCALDISDWIDLAHPLILQPETQP